MTRSELAAYVISPRLSELETAIRFLWLLNRKEGQFSSDVSLIAKFFEDQSLSHPNRSRLGARLIADRRVLKDAKSGSLRLTAKALSDLDAEFEAPAEQPRPTSALLQTLRAHALSIQSVQTRAFVEEAISCAENATYRAAIIMAWCGAVSILQEYVFANHLAAFNTDAVENKLLKSAAISVSDMRNIAKETQFLELLARISLIDDSTKKNLKRCLDRRNEVGHPSEVRVSEAAVADHIDSLIMHVFQRFAPALRKA